MNHSCSFRRLFAFCAVALLSALSAYAFEGKVGMTMTMGKNTYPVTYYIKGLRMRTETKRATDKKGHNMEAITIFNMESHEGLMLMMDQKMYMTMHLDTDALTDGKAAQALDFKPTGRKEKIAGYDTEEYAGISEGKRIEMWVTKELGQFLMANQGKPGRKASQSAQWEKFMLENSFFPLRTIQREKKDGPEQLRLEATSVEKIAVSDSLFQPPEGFQKIELPDMGNIFKSMIPGR